MKPTVISNLKNKIIIYHKAMFLICVSIQFGWTWCHKTFFSKTVLFHQLYLDVQQVGFEKKGTFLVKNV